MEEKNVVETTENEEVETVKESKVKTVLTKVGSGVKRHWKTIAVGAGALAVGVFLGKRNSDAEDDGAVDTAFEEVEETDDDSTATSEF